MPEPQRYRLTPEATHAITHATITNTPQPHLRLISGDTLDLIPNPPNLLTHPAQLNNALNTSALIDVHPTRTTYGVPCPTCHAHPGQHCNRPHCTASDDTCHTCHHSYAYHHANGTGWICGAKHGATGCWCDTTPPQQRHPAMPPTTTPGAHTHAGDCWCGATTDQTHNARRHHDCTEQGCALGQHNPDGVTGILNQPSDSLDPDRITAHLNTVPSEKPNDRRPGISVLVCSSPVTHIPGCTSTTSPPCDCDA